MKVYFSVNKCATNELRNNSTLIFSSVRQCSCRLRLKRFPKNLISAFEKNGAKLPKLYFFQNLE